MLKRELPFNFHKPSYIKHTTLIGVLVLILDQMTKHQIITQFHLYEVKPIISFFNIVRAHNTGAAFSFLADAGGWQHYFFIIIGLIMTGVLTYMQRQTADRFRACLMYSLIVFGAIGNLIDRFRYGYVVDFLDVFIMLNDKPWHWPAFNVADSAICIGAILLIWDAIVNPST